jgi:hypothetical protein
MIRGGIKGKERDEKESRRWLQREERKYDKGRGELTTVEGSSPKLSFLGSSVAAVVPSLFLSAFFLNNKY